MIYRLALLLLGCLVPIAWGAEIEDFDIRYVGPLFNRSKNDGNITGQDGAYSIDLGKRSLWLFGDTFYGSWKEGGTQDIKGAVHNNAAWATDTKASDGIGELRRVKDANGNADYALRNTSSEDPKKLKLWPGHGIKIDGQIYVFYSLVEIFGTGSWDFRHAGQGLAVTHHPKGPFKRLTYKENYDFWERSQPRFGVAVLRGKDGRIYVYGRDEVKPHGFKLARVAPEEIEDPERYEYFSGDGKNPKWTRNLSKAKNLFKEGPPEGSVSFNPFLGKHLMLYSRFIEQDVIVRTASNPWGPWSEPKSIYRCIPSKLDATCYAAKEHPQYAEEGGRKIYFTLVDSGEAFGGIPELFQVTLHKESKSTVPGNNWTKIYKGAARRIAESFNSGDYTFIRKGFSPGMSKAFPSKHASEFFETLKQKYGKVKTLGNVRLRQSNQAVIPATFEHGVLDIKIALDSARRIDGLWFLPHTPDIPVPKRHETRLSLPFKGTWLVFWGGDTRKLNTHHDFPNQRFAFDFVGVNEEDKTHKGEGLVNEDYYAFEREILAPADGVVTDVIRGVRDNLPGSMNQFSALGNTVVIEHRPHEVSVLAHLQLGNIRVKVGDKVKRGQVIGLCGNSGNSSEPHLHYHLQNTPIIQAGTGIKVRFEKVSVKTDRGRQTREKYSPVKAAIVSPE